MRSPAARFALLLALVLGGAGCGSDDDTRPERCTELDASLTPAETWDDVDGAQERFEEWLALGCNTP